MEATDFPARLARADLVITGEGRIDAQTAFGKTALGVAKRAAAAGVPCIAVGGGVEVDGIAALAEVGATAVPVVERPHVDRGGDGGGCRATRALRRATCQTGVDMVTAAGARAGEEAHGRGSASSPTRARATRSGSSDTGPGLRGSRSTQLEGLYGRPVWERRLDPTSELILTILTQNSADVNAEVAFEALRQAYPSGLAASAASPGRGLGRGRATGWRAAGLGADRVRADPRVDRRDPAGRPGQSEGATACRSTLRKIREERGDYSLEFLGDMTRARGARRG